MYRYIERWHDDPLQMDMLLSYAGCDRNVSRHEATAKSCVIRCWDTRRNGLLRGAVSGENWAEAIETWAWRSTSRVIKRYIVRGAGRSYARESKK